MKWDVFLAHTGHDTPTAEIFFNLLDPHANVFLDSKRLMLGDDWDLALARAQRDSLVSVILVSSKTEQAYYEREEIASAIQYARDNPDSHRVVPIYLDEAAAESVPYGLRLKHGLFLKGPQDIPGAADQLRRMLDQLAAG